VAAAAQLVNQLAQRAPQADRDGSFNHDNIADLHRHGLLALAVPAARAASMPISLTWWMSSA